MSVARGNEGLLAGVAVEQPQSNGLRIGSAFVAFTVMSALVSGLLFLADVRGLAAGLAALWAFCVVLASPRAGVVLALTFQVWDVALNPAEGSGYEWVSPGRVLSILAVGSYLFRWIAGHRWRIRAVRPAILLFCAFVLWGMFSIAWAMDQSRAVWAVLKLTTQVGLAVVAVDLLADPKALRQTLLLMALGGTSGALYTLLGGIAVRAEAGTRLAVAGIGVNSVAISIGMVVVSTMALMLMRRSLLTVLIALGCMIALMLVALRTGTRSVLIGVPLAIAVGALVAYWRKVHKLILIILVVGGLSGGSLYWAVQAEFIKGRLRDRLLSVFEFETYETNIRKVLWSEAVTLYAHNPLGVGAGNEPLATAAEGGGYGPLEAHNAFVSVLVEYNVVGQLLLVGGLCYLMLALLRVGSSGLRAGAAMLLMFGLLSAMKGSIQVNRILWQPILLAMTMIEADYRVNRAAGQAGLVWGGQAKDEG